MRVVGVDPSSSSSGLTYLVDGALIGKAVWKPTPKMTRPAALMDYEDSLREWLRSIKARLKPGQEIDLAVVAQLANIRGMKVVRALAQFEGATYIAIERQKIPILTVTDAMARHTVLGLPITSSKADAHIAVREQFPDLRWSPVKQGGEDEIDSFVVAKAGPLVLRQQR